MGSTDVIARDQVLADLATLGTGTNDAVSLLSQTRDLARFADQVQGELARLAGIVDASGAYAEVGYTSAAAFLRYGCGRSAVRAGELVAAGRARPRLRATAQALAEGRVSFDAAHVISRATTQIEDDTLAAAAEQQLLTAATTGLSGSRSAAEAAARYGTASGEADGASAAACAPGDGEPSSRVPPGLDPRELRRLGEDLTYRADPDAVEERQGKRFERRYLSFGITLDNVGTISGACSDALSVEIIKTAVDAFSPPGGGEDRRTAAQRRMDGLTAACQAALDSGAAGSRHGAMLTARQVLTLACRAEISVIRWKDGLPLNVGRRYRTETPALRRALTARDRGCRWPGCGLPAGWCTAHHLRPWKLGGATRLPNLVLLCFVHHHYFIHLLGWTLTGTADALLRFTHPGGWLTLDSPLPTQPASRGP